MQRLILLLLLTVVLFCGCKKKKQAPSGSQAYPVLTALVTSQNVDIYKEAFGTLMSPDAITLTAQANGEIIDIPVKEGSFVRAGDLIAQIDPRIYQASLDSAIANLEKDKASLVFAQAQVDAYKQLLPQDYVAEVTYAQYVANLETTKAMIKADEANIEQAQVNLGYTHITAPVDGVIGLVQFNYGNFVNAGQQNATITTLQQVQPIYALYAMPESDLDTIRKHMRLKPLKVVATFIDPAQKPLEGEVLAINNTIDAQTGTIMIKATFPNKDINGWPGQFVRIKTLLETKENAIVIPVSAVQIGQNGLFVYVVQSNNTVAPQPVVVSDWIETSAVISSGLSAGQIVVTDGQLNLYPGAPIQVQKEIPLGSGVPG